MGVKKKVRQCKKGAIKEIFDHLSEVEMACGKTSFTLDNNLSEDEKDKVMKSDMDELRHLCLQAMEEANRSRMMVTVLEKEVKEANKKVSVLEGQLNSQEERLSNIIAKLDENKQNLETAAKRSEERADKMEQDKQALESCVKKAEASMNMKFNEVVKLSKGVEEGKSEISKMSSKVNDVVTNVKGLVKGEIKENAAIIREECDRAKSIIISGIPEPNIESAVKRQDHLKKEIGKIFDAIKDPEDKWMEEVLDIKRLGKYITEKGTSNKRPVKVRFDQERTAREVIALAKKLSKVEEMKGIYINKDLSASERIKLRELRGKAREENESRSEEQARNYFFAVRRGKVMKLFKRGLTEEELGATGGEEAPSTQ